MYRYMVLRIRAQKATRCCDTSHHRAPFARLKGAAGVPSLVYFSTSTRKYKWINFQLTSKLKILSAGSGNDSITPNS
ncbi:hypothetical protein PM082_003845 [Marasmius tenuissimus]|nr:hypothetical protein PM082_003845 [Marasmius tenuissimus]